MHCFCACRKLLINSISNIHDIGISNLRHPQNQEKPARVWFFICQKISSNCFSGKADAIPFLNIKLTSPKHCLSFKSMASTFPQKQSETSQSANKKMIHLHALLHRRTRYYNALFFEDAFHFQYNLPFKLKLLIS